MITMMSCSKFFQKKRFVTIVLQTSKLYNTCSVSLLHRSCALFHPNNVSSTFKRMISFKGFRQPTVEKFRTYDNIPDSYDLIYRSSISKYLYATQVGAAIAMGTLCILLLSTYGIENEFRINIKNVALKNIRNTKQQMGMFTAAFGALYLSVILLMKKCPVRIYFNSKSKQYLGIIYSTIPTKKNIIQYKIGEIAHTPTEGIFPWNEYKYKLKNGKILVMLDHSFRKPDDLNIMLGYTKL